MNVLNNARNIRLNKLPVYTIKLNGTIIFDRPRYCIEYTVNYNDVEFIDKPLNYLSTEDAALLHRQNAGLPFIYSDPYYDTFGYDDGVLSYSEVSIEKLDGTITNDLNTPCGQISKVRLWYPEDTKSLRFICPRSTKKSSIKSINSIDTRSMTHLDHMFYYCASLKSVNTYSFDTRKVVDMSYMFCCCYKLESLDLRNFNTSNVTNMSYMFSTCNGLTTLDLSSFNTSKVTDMCAMFSSCGFLTTVDLSSFNTSEVTDMRSVFSGCQSLKSLDLSNFDTSNVTDMDHMFNYCQSLQSLNLSNFDTSKVTNIRNMFCNCESLRTLNLSNWDISNATYTSGVFTGCFSLKELRLLGWTYENFEKVSSSLPTDDSIISRKIYYNDSSFEGKTAPEGWEFIRV